MIIKLQGQLQTAAGLSNTEIHATSDDTLKSVIQRTAADLPDAARSLILTDDGDVRTSLFVATDGEHTRDLNQPATANELLLMPPMAGG